MLTNVTTSDSQLRTHCRTLAGGTGTLVALALAALAAVLFSSYVRVLLGSSASLPLACVAGAALAWAGERCGVVAFDRLVPAPRNVRVAPARARQ